MNKEDIDLFKEADEIIQDLLDDPYSELTIRRAKEILIALEASQKIIQEEM